MSCLCWRILKSPQEPFYWQACSTSGAYFHSKKFVWQKVFYLHLWWHTRDLRIKLFLCLRYFSWVSRMVGFMLPKEMNLSRISWQKPKKTAAGLWFRHVPCPRSIVLFPTFRLKDLFHFVWIIKYVLGEGNGCCTASWCIPWCVKHYSSFCIAVSLLGQVSVLVMRFLHCFLYPSVWSETSNPMVILANWYFQIKDHLKRYPNNLCWRCNSLLLSMKVYSQIHKHVLVLGRTHDNPASWKSVLVSPGIELIFFLVPGTVLCLDLVWEWCW